MAEKLTEASWTSHVKKLKVDLDDKALVKALAAWDKTDEAKPEPRLKAVEELIRQLQEQVKAIVKRKKDLGDKPFGELKDKLYALLEVAEPLEKSIRKAIEAAASSDDEEDSPALLTSKMIPLIRAVRKGDIVLQSLIAVAGRETFVLLSRKAISPARGKLLKEQMTNPSGLKFIRGECLFEANSLTFVVQGGASGLAKKIKAALLAQTELRLKVRVRGEDPDDVEEEGEEEAGAEAGAETASTPAGPAASATPAPAQPAPAADPRPDGNARFTARLTALMPKIKAATDANIKTLTLEAGVAARNGSFEAAEHGLDEIERLLDPARRDKALAAWQAERTAAIAALKSVAGKIAAARHASSAKAILEIQAVMKNLTAAPATLQQVTELRNYVGSDDIVHDVSELADDIRTPLLGALDKLRAELVG